MHTTHENDELLTTTEVAKILRLSRDSILKYRKQGLIPAYRIGNRLRFKRSEIDQVLVNISTLNQ